MDLSTHARETVPEIAAYLRAKADTAKLQRMKDALYVAALVLERETER